MSQAKTMYDQTTDTINNNNKETERKETNNDRLNHRQRLTIPTQCFPNLCDTEGSLCTLGKAIKIKTETTKQERLISSHNKRTSQAVSQKTDTAYRQEELEFNQGLGREYQTQPINPLEQCFPPPTRAVFSKLDHDLKSGALYFLEKYFFFWNNNIWL